MDDTMEDKTEVGYLRDYVDLALKRLSGNEQRLLVRIAELEATVRSLEVDVYRLQSDVSHIEGELR